MYASHRRRRERSPTSDAARLDSYPHPYPAGWYRLLDSRALQPGELRYFECLGRQLVLWRSDDGIPNAMHAFCPHMGANLPYSDHLPDGILTETFPVQEVHGQIFMYHACDDGRQSATEAPPYPLPRIPEVDDGKFTQGIHRQPPTQFRYSGGH